jgi:hypothetical protein
MTDANINEMVRLLQELLHEHIEELARETKFIQLNVLFVPSLSL